MYYIDVNKTVTTLHAARSIIRSHIILLTSKYNDVICKYLATMLYIL